MFERDVPLAPLTTLGLGGSADYFLAAQDETTLLKALRWAREEGHPVTILGGGSNAVVPDEGVRGLVIQLAMLGIEARGKDSSEELIVAGGENWDTFVSHCVDRDFAGVECLAGIPGLVGATPIQNVGAYGQEVAETITRVRCIDRRDLSVVERTHAECGFAYRHSDFKANPGRFVVTHVHFRLTPGGAPARRYGELLRASSEDASLSEVRDTIVELRRRKSMVLDDSDPNSRSAGSFFTNPIIDAERAKALIERCVDAGMDEGDIPRWPDEANRRTKFAAAWLIEKAGFVRGTRRGNVGQSSVHALALVHYGGGTTTELLAFAQEIQQAVFDRFGVQLEREPRVLGDTT